jgi:mucin-19
MQREFLRRVVFSTMAAVSLCAVSARANPLGGSVVGGSANATIGGEGTALTTINQTADRVIINWQDFSIGLGELTRFVQPGANAAALNRVISGNPSQLLGSLQANGQVFLINQNGILVGPSATINAGSFIGSTLDLADSAFMSGANMTFSGSSLAGVENLGTINALGGDIFLFGHTVKNSGSITAGGTIGLAAGSSIELRQSGNERLGVILGNNSAPQSAAGVDNSGTVQATSAEIKAAGGNIYALAINNGGTVRAEPKLVFEGGKLVLKSEGGTVVNTGTLDASNNNPGGKGGEIQVLGDKVGLGGSAVVNASGDAGGGTILVGGDFQGANPAVLNATATYVGSGVTLSADALTAGDGGKVIVWSDVVTRYYGSISAEGGQGGFAEISGAQYLDFNGSVQVGAGSILLDPRDLTIAAVGGGAGQGDDQLSAGGIAFGTPSTATDVTVSATAVQNLGAGFITLDAHRDLFINSALSLTTASGNTATFRAGRNLQINATVDAPSGGNLAFVADHTLGQNLGTGTLTISAAVGGGTAGVIQFDNDGTGGIVLSGTGSVTSGTSITFNNPVTLQADTTFNSPIVSFGVSATVNGDVNLTFGTGAILNAAVGGTTPLRSINVAGNTTLNASVTTTAATGGTGNQTYNGPVTLGGSPTLTALTGGNVTFGSSITANAAGRALAVAAPGTTTFGGDVGGGANPLASINVSGAGPVALNASAITTTGSQTYNGAATVNSTANSVTLTGGNITFNSTLRSLTDGEETLTISGTGTTTFGGAVGDNTQRFASLTSNNGGTTAINGGSVTTTGAQTYADNVTLGAATTITSSGGGAIAFNGTINNGQTLSVTTTGTATFAASVGTGTALTTLTVDADGGITVGTDGSSVSIITTGVQNYNTDPVTIRGDVTFQGTDGTFTGGIAGNGGGNDDLTLNFSANTTLPGIVNLATIRNLATGGGGNTLITADITVTGTQTYNDPVEVQASVNLTGTTVTFNDRLESQTGFNYNVTVTGNAVFGNGGLDPVGSVGALGNLAVTGATTINSTAATDITTTGGQSYGDGVSSATDVITLGADTTLTSTGGGTINLRSTVNSASGELNSLTVNTAGLTQFEDVVGGVDRLSSITTDAAGFTFANANINVNGAAATTFNDAFLLRQNLTVDQDGAGNVNFAGTVDSETTFNRTLTVNTAGGAVIFGAAVGSDALGGSSEDTGLGSVTTSGTGSTQINGGSILTTGAQTYGTATSLGANAVLTGGSITFNATLNGAFTLNLNSAGATTIAGIVGGSAPPTSLTTDAGGTTTISANVTTATTQTYNDAVVISGTVVLTGTTGTFASTLNGAGGAADNLTLAFSSDFDIVTATLGFANLDNFTAGNGEGGLTRINGTITTSAAQTYNDAVVLLGNSTLNGANVTFNSTINADAAANNRTLTVNDSGTTTFGGIVGGAQALLSLTTDGAGITIINTSGITSATVTINDPARISVDTTINGATAVTFSSTIGSELNEFNDLTVNSALTTFAGQVGTAPAASDLLGSVTTSGATVIGAGVSTALNAGTGATGNQSYGGTLTLSSAGVNTHQLSGVNGTFTGGIDGAGGDGNNDSIRLSFSGTTTLPGTGLANIVDLTTDNGGTTVITANITTTGFQQYDDAVQINATVNLTGTTVTFNSTLNADATANNRDLTVTGNAVFGNGGADNVGGSQQLNDITVTGNTTFNIVGAGNDVAATGNQTYGDNAATDAITLSADTSFNGVNDTLTFNGTVDGGFALSMNMGIGTVNFNAAVGGSTPLASVTDFSNGETVNINGGLVRATGAISFSPNFVNLNSATDTTTIESTLGGAITFGSGAHHIRSVTDGQEALTITTSGLTTLNSPIGSGGLRLASLTVNGTGTVDIGAATITTTGAQTYSDNVNLTGGVLMTGVNVSFNGTLNGGQILTVTDSGTTTFAQPVGGGTRLTSLTVNGGGTTAINGGSILTTGNQTYTDNVTIGAVTTINSSGGSVAFSGTLSGAFTLSVTGGGTTAPSILFDGTVSTLTSLTANGANGVTIDADVTVAGPIVVNADTDNEGNGTFTISSGTTQNTGAGNDITITAARFNISTATALTSADQLTVTASNNHDIGLGAAALTLQVDNTELGILTAPGGTTFSSSNTGNGIQANGAVFPASAGNITLNATGNGITFLTAGTTAGGGITATAGGAVRVQANVTSTTGAISLNGGSIELGATLQTDSQTITLNSGAGILLTASAIVDTETGNDGNGGAISITATGISGNAAGRDLTLDTSTTGAFNGGAINLVTMNAAGGNFLNDIVVDSRGGAANGIITASGVTIAGNDDGGGDLSSLTVSGTLRLSGVNSFDMSDSTATAGDINLQNATVSATAAGTTLSLNSNGTGQNAGNIDLGVFDNGGGSNLQTLTATASGTGASGTIDFFGTAITTTAAQSYTAGGGFLQVNLTLTGTAVTFSTPLDNNFTLLINASGATTFNGRVGSTTPLSTITTDAPGTVIINTDVIRAQGGTITFNDPVTLTSDVTLTDSGATGVFFNSTVASDATPRALTVNTTGGGITRFAGTVGSGNPLASVTTDATGTTEINGGLVRTTGAQDYNDNVTVNIGAGTPPTAITTTANGNVNFDGTLTLNDLAGANGVTVTAGTGNVTFTGAVTINDNDLTVASSALATVTGGISGSTGNVDFTTSTRTDVDGAIALTGAGTVTLDATTISGVNITTVGGNITFGGAVIVDATDGDNVIDIGTGAGAGKVDFQGTLTLNDLGGANALRVTAGTGDVDFDGAVQINDNNLTVVSSAITTVTAGIAGSTGNVDFTTTTRSDIDGSIALTGAGTVTLDAATISGASITTVGGDITFGGAVIVDATDGDSVIDIGTGAGAGKVDFQGTLTLNDLAGANALRVTAGTGDVDFDGAVTINDNNLTVVSSALTTVTAGISGSTGSIDFTTSTRTDVDGAITLTGAGTVTLDAATISGVNITTVGGNITFGGAVIVDATDGDNVIDIGTGAGAGKVDFQGTLTLNDLAGDNSLRVTAGTGDVDFDGAVTLNDNSLTVVSSGTTTEAAGISGSTGNVDITASTGITLTGAVTLTTGDVRLNSGGAVTHAAAITADQLQLVGAGTFTLNTVANDVNTLSANTGGLIYFTDSDDLTVGSTTVNANTVAGITTSNDNVRLTTAGATTISSAITLNSGTPVGDTLTLNVGGGSAVTQTAPITAAGLQLLDSGASGSTFTLFNSGNEIIVISANVTGDVQYRDASGLILGAAGDAISVFSGINSTADVTLQTGAGLTQNNVVVASGLELLGTGPVTLTLGNTVSTLAANLTMDATGGLSFNNGANALTIGTVTGQGTAGITTVNSGVIIAAGALTIGTGAGQDISAGTATVDLNVAGATEGAGSVITAGSLRLQGTGNFTLTEANDVNTIAANINGTLNYTDTDDLTVGTVTTVGITTVDDNVTLTAGGKVSVTQVINTAPTTATTVAITAGSDGSGVAIDQTAAGVITATSATFTASTATIDNADILLGTANNNVSGAVTFAETTADGLRDVTWRNVSATATWPTFPAAATINDLTVQHTMTGINITAALTLKDITGDSGDLNLLAGAGAITQTGGSTLTIPGTTTLSATGNITLTENNDFDSAGLVAGDGVVTIVLGGDVSITDINDIIIDGGQNTGMTSLTVNALGGDGAGGVLGTIFIQDATPLTTPTIQTLNNQLYNGHVVLNQDTVLKSTAAGSITFQGNVNSDAVGTPRDLTVNTGGITSFNGANIGNTAPLDTLTTDDDGGFANSITTGERTRITGTITTVTTQTYNDPVELQSHPTTFTSTGNGNIQFTTTIDGAANAAQSLVVNTGGVTILGGAIGLGPNNTFDGGGDDRRLRSLTTDFQSGPNDRTQIGSVTIAMAGGASVTFNDPVLLTANLTIHEAGGNSPVTFVRTVDSDLNGPWSLTVNTTGEGTTTFGGAVGNDALGALSHDSGLASVTTDGFGMTVVNGGIVRTTGNQTFNDDVVIADSDGGTPNSTTTFISLSAGTILFDATLDDDGVGTFGAEESHVIIRTDGIVQFNGLVGDVDGTFDGAGDDLPISSLDIAHLSTPTVWNAGTTYAAGELVTDNGDTWRSLAGGNLNNPPPLRAATGGTRTDGVNWVLAGEVRMNNAVDSFLPNADTAAHRADAAVFTSGNQTYNKDVILMNATRDYILRAGGGDDLVAGGGEEPGPEVASIMSTITINARVDGQDAQNGTLTPATHFLEGLKLYTDSSSTTQARIGIIAPLEFLDISDGPNGANGQTITLTSDTEIQFLVGTAVLGFVNAGGFDLTITANDITFAAGPNSVMPGGATSELILRPISPVTPMRIGPTFDVPGEFSISDDDLLAIADGFGAITFGRFDGANPIIVETSAFRDPVRIETPVAPGTVSIVGRISSTATPAEAAAAGLIFAQDQNAANVTILVDGFGLGAGVFPAEGAGVLILGPGSTTFLGANIDTTGTPIQFTDAVIMTGDSTLNTTAGGSTAGADIIFDVTLNDDTAVANEWTLTLNAGTTGDIDFRGAIGDGSGGTAGPLNSIVILNARDVDVDSTVMVGSFTQVGGTGSTILRGSVTTTLAQGVNITTTTGITLGDDGDASMADATPNFSGDGAANGITVTTGGNPARFNAPAILAGGAATVTVAAGSITFESTINGAQTLTLNSSATTSLRGLVGGGTALTSLTTDAGGGGAEVTQINGGGVTTTGAQAYGDNVMVGVLDATLTSTGDAAVTFTGTLNGAQAVTVNTGGTTTFTLAVGGVIPLTSLTTDDDASVGAGEVTAINGGAVTTSGTQTYNEAVTLGATATLTGATVTFNNTLDAAAAGVQGLAVTGNAVFGNGGTDAVGGTASLSALAITGNTTFNSTSATDVTVTVSQTYGDNPALDAITLLADTTLSGGATVTFNATIDGAFAFSVVTGGTTQFNGVVGAATPLTSLTTDDFGGAGVFDPTFLNAASFSAGTIAFNDPVGIQVSVVINGTTSVLFGSTIGSTPAEFNDLTVNSPTTTFGGLVGTAIGVDSLGSVTTSGAVAINGGGVTTETTGGHTGSQSYGGGATLGAGTTLTAGGSLSFGSTLNGSFDLTLAVTGASTFTGAVGGVAAIGDGTGAAITINSTGATEFVSTVATASGIVQAAAAGTVTFRDSVTIAGTGNTDSLFNNSVVLDGLTFTSGDSVTFGSSSADVVTLSGGPVVLAVTGTTTVTSVVNGNQDLTINSTGTTAFGAAVGGTTAATEIGDGTGASITFGAGAGAVTFASTVRTQSGFSQSGTAGLVTFADNVTVANGDTASTFSGSVTLDGLTFDSARGATFGDAAADVVTLSSGPVTLAIDEATTFNAVVNGNQDLTINSAGTTTFLAAVGGAAAGTQIGDGTGASVIIGAGAGAVTFSGTLRTATGITQSGTAAAVLFDGDVNIVGAGTATTLSGNVVLDGLTFTSAGAVTVGDAGTDTLTLSEGNVTLAVAGVTTVNSATDGAFDLVISSTGATTFLAPVGFNTAVGDGTGASISIGAGAGAVTFSSTLRTATGITQSGTAGLLTFDGDVNILGAGTATALSGSVTLDGLTFTSAGAVTIGDAAADVLTLSEGNVTVTSTGAGATGNVTINATVTGAQALAVNTAGTTAFNGPVGTPAALTSVTTDAAGTTTFAGGAVTTTGSQSYNDPATLGAGTTLTAGGSLSFGSTLNGSFDLTLAVTGASTFTGAVGGVAAIGDGTGAAITINSTGATEFVSTVATASGIVQAAAAGTVTFRDSVTIAGTGNTDSLFNNSVVLDGLTFTSGDSVTFGSSSADVVTLSGGPVVLAVTGTTTVTSVVNGNQDLTINSTGTTAFGAAVGGTTAATEIGDGTGASITFGAGAGAVTFASTVRTQSGFSQSGTAGLVTFADNVTVANGDTASTFSGSVTLDGLTFDSARGATFGDAAADVVTLSSGPVTLAIDEATTFNAVVNGNQDLTINSAGTTTFLAAVGGAAAGTQIGDGTGASVIIGAGAGAVTFSGTLRTATGITQSGTAAAVLFDGDVNIVGAGTATTLSGNVVLDGLTFTSAGAVTVGDAGTDTLTLSEGNVTLAVAGVTTVNSATDGAFDLVISSTGATTFLAPVGFNTAVGDGTGASISIGAGAGAVTFSSTLRTATGITQSGTAGLLTFDGDVNILGAGTATALSGSVTLDGLTFTSAGAVTIGDAAADVLTLSEGNVTLAVTGITTVNATVNGGVDLIINSTGATSFTSTVGATTAIGDGTGASVTIGTSAGAVTFASTLRTATGIIQDGTAGLLTLDGDTTVLGAAAATVLNGSVTLDGLTFTSAGAVTIGDAAADALTLSEGNVTLAVAGITTVNATVNGGVDLIINSTGATTFTSTVGATTAIGDGTGASIAVGAGAGAVTFSSTVRTATGITQSGTAGVVTFDGGVTVLGAGTASVLNGSVVLDGLTFTSAGAVTFGDAAADALTLSEGDVTLAVAGITTVNSTVDGGVDLIISSTGATTFLSTVGATAAIGDGTGASIAVSAGAGAVTFASTVRTETGITQSGTAGLLLFDGNVTVLGVDTATTLNGSVTFDGMTLTSAGVVTIGDAAADALTLSEGDVTLAVTGATTVNSTVNGGVDLIINSTGTTTFTSTVGATTAIGDGGGASLTIGAGAGAVTFNSTLRTTTGITQGGTAGVVTFDGDVTVLGAGTGTTLNGNVVLDGLTFTSAGAVTIGDVIGADTLTLSEGNVTLAVAGVTTVNSTVNGSVDLIINSTGASTFNAPVGATAAIGDGVGASITIGAGAAAVTFNSTVRTTTGITQSGAAGLLTFDGDVTILGAATPTTLNGSVVLDGLTFTSAGAITFGDVAGAGDTLVLSEGPVTVTSTGAGATGNITFNAATSGAQTLTVNTAGATTFNGTVGIGGAGALTSVTTDGPGTVAINGGLVTTTGAQTYGELAGATIGAGVAGTTTLTSTGGAAITFAGTLDDDGTAAASNLIINTSGATTFGGVVGGITPLTSILTQDSTGAAFSGVAGDITAINGGAVTTTGAQTYNEHVTLGANTILTSTTIGDITIGVLGPNGVFGPTTLTSTAGAPVTLIANGTANFKVNAAINGVVTMNGTVTTSYVAPNSGNTGINLYLSNPVSNFIFIFTQPPAQYRINAGVIDMGLLFSRDNWLIETPLLERMPGSVAPEDIQYLGAAGGQRAGLSPTDRVVSIFDLAAEEELRRKK